MVMLSHKAKFSDITAMRRIKILRKEYASFRPEVVDFFVKKVLPRARAVLDPMAGTSPLIPYIEYSGISAHFNDILPIHLFINRAKTYTTYYKISKFEENNPGSLKKELCYCMLRLKNHRLVVSNKWIHDDILEGLLAAWAKTKSYEREICIFFQAVIMLCVREYSCMAPSEKNSTWNRPGGMTTEKSLNDVVQECIERFFKYYSFYYAGKDVEGGALRFSADSVCSLDTSTEFDTILTSPAYPNRCDYVIAYAPEIYFLSKCEGTPSIEELRLQIHGTNVVKNYQEYERDYQLVSKKSPKTGDFLTAVREKQRSEEKKNDYYFRYFTRYYADLYKFFDTLIKLLATGGSFYIVVQNNIHRGELNELDKSISNYLQIQGLKVVIEQQWLRGHQGRRNISEEHPLVLRKHQESIIRAQK